MASNRSRSRLPRELRGVPWITDDGGLDLRVFPIESVLLQAHDPDPAQFRTGCVMLASMCAAGDAQDADL